MKCEKCNREYPDNLKQPFMCFCDSSVASQVDVKKIIKKNKNNVSPEARKSALIMLNQSLWAELHNFVFDENLKEWFMEWSLRVPCGDCKSHWFKIIEDFPPDFSSEVAFFEWTIEAHNKVNKRLQKPIISIEEAKKIWKRQY